MAGFSLNSPRIYICIIYALLCKCIFYVLYTHTYVLHSIYTYIILKIYKQVNE